MDIKSKIIEIKANIQNGTFRTKLLIFFLLLISIIFLAFIYIYISLQIIIKDTSDMFEKNVELSYLHSEVILLQRDIEEYLSSGSSEVLLSYYDHGENINETANNLIKNTTYSQSGIKSKNIANMSLQYVLDSEKVINAKRGRNTAIYNFLYENSLKQNKEIISYINEIMSSEMISTSEKYFVLSKEIKYTTIVNSITLLIVLILVVLVIISFSKEITRPITKLASYATKVSEGDFEIKVDSSGKDEVGHLYRAFGLMIINIKNYIVQIREKAMLETTLKEAELLALQSQVNPHFIFNTINIGAKIALMQEDRITSTYLEHAADIFRYNLRNLDENVTLKDEIKNVSSYAFLLKTRFGDRIKFEINSGENEKLLKTNLPRMILQPIVENAYIHGIGDLEKGGSIFINVSETHSKVIIDIADTGKGISAEKISELLYYNQEKDIIFLMENKGHTTGIGVDNVLKRLRLYFSTYDIMDIKCEDGKTHFIIKLPK